MTNSLYYADLGFIAKVPSSLFVAEIMMGSKIPDCKLGVTIFRPEFPNPNPFPDLVQRCEHKSSLNGDSRADRWIIQLSKKCLYKIIK